MNRLNPEKLSVEFRDNVTPINPIIPRKYTLTHSDETAELFLTIGKNYAYDKISKMRDEVLGKWIYNNNNNKYIYYAYVYVNGKFDPNMSYIRNMIFIRELPLALEAIRYGDSKFFKAHPRLDYAPIYIRFDSEIPYLNRIEYWGTFSNYK